LSYRIAQGDFVEARGRPWLVEVVDDSEPGLTTVRLSCIADDAQGEQVEVLWDAEIGTSVLAEDTWSRVGRGAPDTPEVLASYLRAIRWRSATAADRDLLQAPFRAGIRLDAYQLLPLRKALRLPRVNLLIADEVGLGKTVEAHIMQRRPAALGTRYRVNSRAPQGSTCRDRSDRRAHSRVHGRDRAGSCIVLKSTSSIDGPLAVKLGAQPELHALRIDLFLHQQGDDRIFGRPPMDVGRRR